MADGYDMDQQVDKYQRTATYYLAKVLQGIFYIVTLLAKLAVDVVKGVFKTFGLYHGGSSY